MFEAAALLTWALVLHQPASIAGTRIEPISKTRCENLQRDLERVLRPQYPNPKVRLSECAQIRQPTQGVSP